MQVLLVLIAVAILVMAGYSAGRQRGYEEGRRATREFETPPESSSADTIITALLGVGLILAAIYLQTREGVRMPTPARLDELAGRAENEAIKRAEAAAAEGKEEKRS